METIFGADNSAGEAELLTTSSLEDRPIYSPAHAYDDYCNSMLEDWIGDDSTDDAIQQLEHSPAAVHESGHLTAADSLVANQPGHGPTEEQLLSFYLSYRPRENREPLPPGFL